MAPKKPSTPSGSKSKSKARSSVVAAQSTIRRGNTTSLRQSPAPASSSAPVGGGGGGGGGRQTTNWQDPNTLRRFITALVGSLEGTRFDYGQPQSLPLRAHNNNLCTQSIHQTHQPKMSFPIPSKDETDKDKDEKEEVLIEDFSSSNNEIVIAQLFGESTPGGIAFQFREFKANARKIKQQRDLGLSPKKSPATDVLRGAAANLPQSLGGGTVTTGAFGAGPAAVAPGGMGPSVGVPPSVPAGAIEEDDMVSPSPAPAAPLDLASIALGHSPDSPVHIESDDEDDIDYDNDMEMSGAAGSGPGLAEPEAATIAPAPFGIPPTGVAPRPPAPEPGVSVRTMLGSAQQARDHFPVKRAQDHWDWASAPMSAASPPAHQALSHPIATFQGPWDNDDHDNDFGSDDDGQV
ncbi:hypothetical protein MKZ38_007733 [Zalerion maritima]|uniref:Uncharacterized protein n=1 Tax=Zalerion maritima TaxID=339359 RepID=A0AAD5WMU0_9PEZI|nr:hypothetical protein MKZ38_007733 [Zalerion maritima]